MNLGIGDMSVHLILKQYLPQQEGDSQNVSSRLTSDFRADKASGIFGLWEYFVGRSVNSLLVRSASSAEVFDRPEVIGF